VGSQRSSSAYPYRNAVNATAFLLALMVTMLMLTAVSVAPPPWLHMANSMEDIALKSLD